MIRKKIQIFSITALIIIATTGMPLSFHFCEMTGSKSFESCDICTKSMVEDEDVSCCNSNNSDENSTAFISDQSCCQTEFVLNKVNDEFLLNKTEATQHQFSLINFPIIVEEINSLQAVNQNQFYCDSSPPFLIDPELHITNSIFLI